MKTILGRNGAHAKATLRPKTHLSPRNNLILRRKKTESRELSGLEDNVIVSSQCAMINGENGDWSYREERGRGAEKQLGLMV